MPVPAPIRPWAASDRCGPDDTGPVPFAGHGYHGTACSCENLRARTATPETEKGAPTPVLDLAAVLAWPPC